MTKTLLSAIAATAVPATLAWELADGSPTDPGKSTHPAPHQRASVQAEPPGPEATPASKANAYGRYCKDESKKPCRRPEGHAVQPVRHGDGQAGQREDGEPRPRLQGPEQEACRRPEEDALQQVHRCRCAAGAGPVGATQAVRPGAGQHLREGKGGQTRGSHPRLWRPGATDGPSLRLALQVDRRSTLDTVAARASRHAPASSPPGPVSRPLSVTFRALRHSGGHPM
jgi:hypothetical protein